LVFYKSIEECMAKTTPNVVLCSGVLQYMEDPSRLVDEINDTAIRVLILDRTPWTEGTTTKLTIQTPQSIYPGTSYPMWIFTKQAFFSFFETKWQLVAIFNSPDGSAIMPNGREFSFHGFLAERILS
jgi:putative methyltransferase (TIGR04325 family)